MKVLQINAVYGIGSTGRTVAEIDEVLKKHGIESIVATTQTTVNRDDIYIVGTSCKSGERNQWKRNKITIAYIHGYASNK